MAATSDTTIETSHKGEVSASIIESAVEKVLRAAEHIREPVRHVDVRIELAPDPARERPAITEISLDVDGTPIRAHVAAPTLTESVDFAVERLSRRIRRVEQRRHRLSERNRTADSGEGEWRHGDLPTHRPEYFPRPYDEREVVRTKSFALSPMTVERAIVDLELLDHRFYLFVDKATGADCIVTNGEDDEVVFRSADPTRYGGASPIEGLSFDETAPPQLSVTGAKEYLDVGDEPYLFFVDEETGRGHVLYRRYDGHYGLVRPE